MRFPQGLCAAVVILSACPLASAAGHAGPPATNFCATVATATPEDTARDERDAGVDEERGAEVDAVNPFEAAMRKIPEAPEQLKTAYADTLEVLSDEGECSAFFGGPDKARQVLDRLVESLSGESMADPAVGIRMKGHYMTVNDMKTGASYRLFEKARINSDGPFFQDSHRGRPLPTCGGFEPNTRGARAVMLLHELGHLVRGADGDWLLPNDGHNLQQGLRNTRVVESKCGARIRKRVGRRAAGGHLARKSG